MDSLSKIKIVTDPEFGEQLLRLYLGKYENRFRPIHTGPAVLLHAGPHPTLVITYTHVLHGTMHVRLYEYISVEEHDPWYGIFDTYQNELFGVSLEDPKGIEKMEKAVAKSFLTGTT
jgi:hypothetical protein